MAIKLADAFIQVLLDYSQAEKDAANMDKQVGGITNATAAKISGAMAAAGAAITGTLGVAAHSAMEFGEGLANVSTLGVKDLAALDAGTRDLAVQFGYDLNDAIQVTYDTLSAGIPEDAAIMVMEQAARGAQAGIGSLSEAMDLGTSAMNAWNLKGANATETTANFEKIMGQAVTAVKLGKTNISEMAQSIGNVAPVMATAGVSTDEFFAAISALTATGMPASTAMNSLRSAVSNVITPGEQASKTAENLGIQFDAAGLQSKGLAGFLADVGEKTGGNIEVMGQLFGSVEGLGSVLALTGAQAGSFKDALGEMANAQDNLTAMQQAFIENNPGQALASLRAELQNLFILIGRTVMPMLNAVIPPVKKVLEFVADLIEAHPRWAAVIGTVVGALGGLLLGLGTLGLTLSAIMPAITFLTGAPGFAGLAGAISGTGAAAAGAAGAGGIGAMLVSLGGLALSATAVIAVLGASGFAVYKFGEMAISTGKAISELARKKGEAARALDEYAGMLEKQGVALDRAALAEMNHAQRSAALTQASINHKEQAIGREISNLTGVEATRDQIHRAELARVALGISVQEAAALAVEGITKEEIAARQSAAAQTRQAEAVKQRAIAATVDQQAAGLAETVNALSRHTEMEQVGASEVSEFKRLMLSGDLEAAQAYWMNLRLQTGAGLGQTLEQYKQFRIAVQAEMQLLRESIAYATNPNQTGSPSLNMEIAKGYQTTVDITSQALNAMQTMMTQHRKNAVAMLTGLGSGLMGYSPGPSQIYAAGASTPMSGGTTNNSSNTTNAINVNVNANGAGGNAAREIANAVREQIGIVLGQNVRDAARARGVRQPGAGGRTPRIQPT